MQSIKLQTEESEGSESRSVVNRLHFLTAGRVSVEDMSKRTGAVRPQLDERCGKQGECDRVLSATNDESGDELNGETDDEDMEDGETEIR